MNRIFHHRAGRAVFSGMVAAVAFGMSCLAVDLPSEWRGRLDAELRKLDEGYADVRHELEEEYAAIVKQRDESNREIHDRIQAIKERKTKAVADVDRELGKTREALAATDIDPDSPMYNEVLVNIDGVDFLNDEYGQSVIGLQRLYQLNAKRYSELERIIQAREALEEKYHQAKRDLAEERINLQAISREGGSGETRDLKVRETAIKDMEKRAKQRYDNAMSALEEYEDLVQDRIRSQRKYIDEQDSILKGMMDGGLTADRRNTFTRQLSVLDAKRAAEERRYQNDLKYIEEKYSFERQRNRELSRMDRDRNEIERVLARMEDETAAGIASLDVEIRNAVGEARTSLEAKRKAMIENRDAERKAYKEALANLDKRDKLLERSMKNRLSYLKDRNNIRIRMAEEGLGEKRLQKYQNDLAKLESKRVEEEQRVRNELESLRTAMPAAYAVHTWRRGNPAVRQTRITGKIDNMVDRLESRWHAREAEFKDNLERYTTRLNANIDAAERARLERERQDLQDRYDAAKRRYENARTSMGRRLEAEQKRIEARNDYLRKREAIRNTSAPATQDSDRRLRELDEAMERHENAYRESVNSAGSVIPAPSTMPTWQERAERRADAVRETGVRRDVREAGEDFTDDVKDAYEWVKDAVVDTYHDVVDYLTD